MITAYVASQLLGQAVLTKEVGLNLTGGPECLLFTATPIIGSLICNSSTKTWMFRIVAEFIYSTVSSPKSVLLENWTQTSPIHSGLTSTKMFQWAQDYRSAVDSVLNSPNLNDPNSPTPYIEFADVSRINDGPVLGWTSFGSWYCSFSLHFRATGQWKACSSNLPRQ